MRAIRASSLRSTLLVCTSCVWIVLWASGLAAASEGFFDANQKQALLEDHNQRRSRLAAGSVAGQPPAADMNRLFWDDGLAELAHRWVAQCQWRHNPRRVDDLDPARTRFRFDPERTAVGENLYSTTDPEARPSLFVKGHESWWNEHTGYRAGSGRCQGVCGHYTQMAWARTRYVGCAYARCPDLAGQGRPQIYYACNYFPGGNVTGHAPYEEGSACTRCGTDRRSCSDGLCSGCMAPAFDFCADFAANCEVLKASCPAACTLDSEASLCSSCRRTCESCPAALLEPEQSCQEIPPD